MSVTMEDAAASTDKIRASVFLTSPLEEETKQMSVKKKTPGKQRKLKTLAAKPKLVARADPVSHTAVVEQLRVSIAEAAAKGELAVQEEVVNLAPVRDLKASNDQIYLDTKLLPSHAEVS